MSFDQISRLVTHSSLRNYVCVLAGERRFSRNALLYKDGHITNSSSEMPYMEHTFGSLCNLHNSTRVDHSPETCLSITALPRQLVGRRLPGNTEESWFITAVDTRQVQTGGDTLGKRVFVLINLRHVSISRHDAPSLLSVSGFLKAYDPSNKASGSVFFCTGCGSVNFYAGHVTRIVSYMVILETARVHDFGISVLATARLPTYESTRSDEGRVKPFLLRVHNVIFPAYYTSPCFYFTVDPRAPTSAGGVEERRPFNAAVTWCGDLWDNESIITYSYMGGNDVQHCKVDCIMQEWTWYTNLSFRKVESGGMIRIGFEPSSGSWSYVARQCMTVDNSKATMNLGRINSSKRSVNSLEKGVILHEFGHALGLLHEHQSPSRAVALTFNEPVTKQYYRQLSRWSDREIEERVLRVHPEQDVSSYSDTDFTSIMMYKLSHTTNAQGRDITGNYNLSELDKAYMSLNYARPEPHRRAPGWTIERALDVAGVTGPRRENILAASDSDCIREIFIQWNVEKRLATRVAIGPTPMF